MRNQVILHIITGLNTGGAEMMLYKLISNRDRNSFQPIVISLKDKGTIGERIEKLGVPVHTIEMKTSLIMPHHIWKLAKLVRSLKPDLLQGWMYHGNLACHLSFGNCPIIWNIRGSHSDLRKLKPLTALAVWLGGKMSHMPYKIINNSRESAKQHHFRMGYQSDKFQIIPNGFDTILFSPSDEARRLLRMELRVSNDTFLIGLIGRFHPVKDHSNFIKAATRLLSKETSNDVHFVLAGRDVDWNNKQLAKQLQDTDISSRFHLLGERNDVPTLNAALDIATLCSVSEGFPNVIGEAMSCGVPCVVTGVGDSSWIVGDTGIIVPPRDPKQLESAWKQILNMEEEKRKELGASARKRIKDLFSIDSIVKQYEKLYAEAIKQ